MSGLTSAGFVTKRIDDIRTELEGDFRDAFGNNVQVDSQSVFGQIIGIMSEREAALWELAEQVYGAGFLTTASGAALDQLGALAGVTRPPAVFSQVTLRLGGTNGTVIPAGSRARDPVLLTEWITQAPATIVAGVADVVAIPATAGPIVGLAGTITAIATPVSGWNTVTNLLDAAVGRDAYNDAAYRNLIHLTMRSGGGSSVDGMRALLLRVDLVTEVAVVENATDLPDIDGRPSHSFEAVVRNGADADIAQTIWSAKPAGITMVGSSSMVIVDAAGDNQTVYFSRPTDRNIWVDVTYEPGDGFPTDGEALIEAAILSYGGTFVMGKDVFSIQIAQQIEVPGLESMLIEVGIAASPSADRVIIPRTHLARFDSSRIVFVVV